MSVTISHFEVYFVTISTKIKIVFPTVKQYCLARSRHSTINAWSLISLFFWIKLRKIVVCYFCDLAKNCLPSEWVYKMDQNWCKFKTNRIINVFTLILTSKRIHCFFQTMEETMAIIVRYSLCNATFNSSWRVGVNKNWPSEWNQNRSSDDECWQKVVRLSGITSSIHQ